MLHEVIAQLSMENKELTKQKNNYMEEVSALEQALQDKDTELELVYKDMTDAKTTMDASTQTNNRKQQIAKNIIHKLKEDIKILQSDNATLTAGIQRAKDREEPLLQRIRELEELIEEVKEDTNCGALIQMIQDQTTEDVRKVEAEKEREVEKAVEKGEKEKGKVNLLRCRCNKRFQTIIAHHLIELWMAETLERVGVLGATITFPLQDLRELPWDAEDRELAGIVQGTPEEEQNNLEGSIVFCSVAAELMNCLRYDFDCYTNFRGIGLRDPENTGDGRLWLIFRVVSRDDYEDIEMPEMMGRIRTFSMLPPEY